MEKNRAELIEIINDAIRYNMVHSPELVSELGNLIVALCEDYGMLPPQRSVLSEGDFGSTKEIKVFEWADEECYEESLKHEKLTSDLKARLELEKQKDLKARLELEKQKVSKGTGNEL